MNNKQALIIYAFISVTITALITYFAMGYFQLTNEFRALSTGIQLLFCFNLIPVTLWPIAAFAALPLLANDKAKKGLRLLVSLLLLYPIGVIALDLLAVSIWNEFRLISQVLFFSITGITVISVFNIWKSIS